MFRNFQKPHATLQTTQAFHLDSVHYTRSTTKYTVLGMSDVLIGVDEASSRLVYDAILAAHVSEKLVASVYRMVQKENNRCYLTPVQNTPRLIP